MSETCVCATFDKLQVQCNQCGEAKLFVPARGAAALADAAVRAELEAANKKAALAERHKEYLEGVIKPLDPRTSRETCIALRLSVEERAWLTAYDALERESGETP